MGMNPEPGFSPIQMANRTGINFQLADEVEYDEGADPFSCARRDAASQSSIGRARALAFSDREGLIRIRLG